MIFLLVRFVNYFKEQANKIKETTMLKSIKRKILLIGILSISLIALIGCSSSKRSSVSPKGPNNSSAIQSRIDGPFRYTVNRLSTSSASIRQLAEGFGICTTNSFFGAHYNYNIFTGSTSNRCRDINGKISLAFNLYRKTLSSDGSIELFISSKNQHPRPLPVLSGQFVAVDDNTGFAMRRATGSFASSANGSSTIEVRAKGVPGDDRVKFILYYNGSVIGRGIALLNNF